MKTIIAFIAIIALASSQAPHPVPIPSLNTNLLNGEWYIVWSYSARYNNSESSGIQCYTWNVTANGATGNITMTINSEKGHQYVDDAVYIAQNAGNSVWEINNKTLAWLGIDIVSNSWAVLGSPTAQVAAIFSRNPNISSVIQTAQIAALKTEGYAINSTNQYTYNNTQCI